MKSILAVWLLGVAVSLAAERERLTGLPSQEDVFVIAVWPHSKQPKDHFTPDSLLRALPELVPADVQVPAGGKVYWQSGVIVRKDKTVLFWRTCGDWFIAIDSPTSTAFYAFQKKETGGAPPQAGKTDVPLVKMAQGGDDSASALDALGKIGGPEAATAIMAALPRLSPTEQESFCRVLGAIGDVRAIEPLVTVLASKDSGDAKTGGEGIFKVRARQAAAEALGRFRSPRTRAALGKAVADDPDWDVYRAARLALYRMDEATSHPGLDDLAATVALAVAREPEPEQGAEAFIRDWHRKNPNYQGAWSGPRPEDFASKTDIERARDAVVQTGKEWDSALQAGGVVEMLMEYLCNRKLYVGPGNAQALLIRIGKAALPALENGVKRGDIVLVKNCQESIRAISTNLVGLTTPQRTKP